MTQPPANDPQGSSTRPYLLRALHEWCSDNGFTPYIAVHVDASVQVPAEYVKNNEIVLNVGFEATANLELGNEVIRFRARFGGTARDIVVPIDHVVAIYARENGQGMAFPMPTDGGTAPAADAPAPRTGLRLAGQGEPTRAPAPAAARAEPRPAPPRPAPRPLPAPTGALPPTDGDPDGSPPDGGGAGKRPRLKRVK